MNDKQLNILRNQITQLIKNNIINVNDISKLKFKKSFDFNNEDDFVSKVLYTIYLNPYILCNDNMLKEYPILSIDLIAPLLIKRYNEEIVELYQQYEEGTYSKEQLKTMIKELKYLYFDSSIISSRIYHIYRDDIVHVSKEKIYGRLN